SVWKRLSLQERYTSIQRYREVVATKREELAYLNSLELGKPLWESKQEVAECLILIDHFLQLGSQTSAETPVPEAVPGVDGVIRYFPLGVLAIVSQSVLPLISIHHHFIPALLNGNTVIIKTTKHAPALGQALAECAHESGLPAGCFNFIQGDGSIASRLTGHPDIDGVFFTGTPETSVAIQKQLLMDYWKIQLIQSGGKNASIVLDDCYYEMALSDILVSSYLTAGQRYTSTSRVLVQKGIFDRFMKDFHRLSKKCMIGYGLEAGENTVFMGPLISETAVEDYLRYQGIATREGCEEIMRGKPLERPQKGYYVSPSIYLVNRADPKSLFQNSEFFGPNIAFYTFNDLDEALEINNQTKFGLIASIYTASKDKYYRFMGEAKVGMVHWNTPTTQISFKMPISGLKKSGNGRPMGSFAGYQCTYPLSTLEPSGRESGEFLIPKHLLGWDL
ncbi:MAG: aldehyde dehydrogenase family protein, partial [Proteobacteria bacterium]|nr:aldehyde dehydrogenase family protein [Pseudomonadota bacterium]